MPIRSAPGAARLSEIIDTPRNGTVIPDILGTALAVPGPGQPLASLDEACRLLSECRDLAQIRLIRDMAEAARLYARAIVRGLEAQNHAAEIKLRAERRAGELLAEMPKQRPGEYQRLQSATVYPPSYEELGIEKTQAHRWQQSATVPERVFEAHLAQTREAGKELTSSGVLALASRFRTPAHQQPAEERPAPLLRFCPPDMATATIVAHVLRVFFPDARHALDLTCGSGKFWDGTAHVQVTALDNDPTRGVDGVVDFRNVPYPNESYDVVLFDPPHIEDGGTESIMAQRFGTYAGGNLESVIQDGCREAWRLARLGIIVKVTDAVHGQRYVLESDWVRAAISQPPYDEVYQTRANAMIDPRWGEQLSAYNNGSTYLIFRKDGPKHVRRRDGSHADA